jgi:hypothetical protein
MTSSRVSTFFLQLLELGLKDPYCTLVICKSRAMYSSGKKNLKILYAFTIIIRAYIYMMLVIP